MAHATQLPANAEATLSEELHTSSSPTTHVFLGYR